MHIISSHYCNISYIVCLGRIIQKEFDAVIILHVKAMLCATGTVINFAFSIPCIMIQLL